MEQSNALVALATSRLRLHQLLKPTLHVEVLVDAIGVDGLASETVRRVVREYLLDMYVTLNVSQEDLWSGCKSPQNAMINHVEVTDYTGPGDCAAFHELTTVDLDIRPYILHPESQDDPRRRIAQPEDEDALRARVLSLPNVALKDEWSSLAFDNALPARLLRCMVRMISLLTQADLNLSTFNLNRLCLLHGPSGSGKSTLCRALAQKLSIRLGDAFARSTLVEINANAMLSKYFSESGKLICNTFQTIFDMASSPSDLVCVVIDEVETIAGSRELATRGAECKDGLRATNQLLTALDRLRNLPNVIVLCTSNLVEAIDPAFLDRVDIKQLIPRPSTGAIYDIFRSCLNELVRSKLINAGPTRRPKEVSASTPPPRKRRRSSNAPQSSISPASGAPIPDFAATIPTFAEANVKYGIQPTTPGSRVLDLARKCEGLSGRTLRRLPMLGLTMHTWGGQYSLTDAVTALEAAIQYEMRSLQSVNEDA